MPKKHIMQDGETRDEFMYRVRAAKCIADTATGSHHRPMQLRAFLAMFHPNMPEREVRALIQGDD